VIYGDFTFIDDVVQANILALQSEKMEFGIYNIGTGIETSFSRLVEIINRHLGTNIQTTYIDNPIKNYVQQTKADITLAKLELGYEPKFSLDDGIAALIRKKCLLVITILSICMIASIYKVKLQPRTWKSICVPTRTLCLSEKPADVSNTYKESMSGK
jgi:hypothetical protein